jgi:translocation protein SEC63
MFATSLHELPQRSCLSVQLKVENPPVAEESPTEDEISEPDEDSLAGQMAAMKGRPVKKRQDYSDDESGTDDNNDDSSDSSDSD